MPRIEVMGDRAEVAEPGQMAVAITALAESDVDIVAVRLPSEADLLVYTRRVDTTLGEADEFCRVNSVPLVVMSTGMDAVIPANPEYPLVVAPNTGLRVLRFLKRVEDQARQLEGWNAQVVEHHQPSKKDTSGTAKKLVNMLGLSPEEIVSIRDFDQSRSAYPSLTEDNQQSYAAHRVTFTNPTDGEQKISEIVVLGRPEYASGLVVVYRALQRPEVQSFVADHGNRVHIVDLLEAGLLE